jgi:cobalt-zinc-cadmium efflux system protein
MFTHAFAITISLVAIIIAARPPCHHRTFGLYRAEILAAFINGLFLLAVGGLIIYEAIERIINPEDILALDMLLIALVGLVVNVVSIFILHGSHKRNINIKGVFYHMIADAASSVGIVVAAIIIYYTKWNIIDPLVSIGISLVIVFWAWGILKESAKILLEMAPTGLNVDMIIRDLKKQFPEIKQLEHAHLWTITADMLVFSAHILLDDTQQSAEAQNRLISKINSYLAQRYHIIESTVQILCEGDSATCPLIPEHNR